MCPWPARPSTRLSRTVTYSARIDFSEIFGPPRACPGCGSVNIGNPDGHWGGVLQCVDCGAQWRLARSCALRRKGLMTTLVATYCPTAEGREEVRSQDRRPT